MTTDGRRIRRARPHDLDALAVLWTALNSLHEAYDPAFAMRSNADGEVRRLLDGMLRDPDVAIFVCEADGPPRRLCGLCSVRVDRAPPILVETNRAEITDLIVRAADRRNGIGRALVDQAFAWVRGQGLERCEVRVAVGNTEGQQFWRALGFGALMDVLHRRL